jgi:hypothetical protein
MGLFEILNNSIINYLLKITSINMDENLVLIFSLSLKFIVLIFYKYFEIRPFFTEDEMAINRH